MRNPLTHTSLFLATVFGLIFSSTASAQSHTWDQSIPGNWTNASLWTPNSIPNGASDWANISVASAVHYTISLDADILLDQLELLADGAILSAVGRDVTVNTLTVTDTGAVLQMNDTNWLGTGTFRVGSGGTLEILGVGSIENLEQNGLVRLIGNSSGSHATLTLLGDATNSGTIQLYSEGSTYGQTILMSGGAFTNNGAVEYLLGNNGNRTFNGPFTNTASGSVRHERDTTLATGPMANSGSWLVEPTATVTFGSGVTFTQADGTLDVQGTFEHDSGIDWWLGGTTLGTPLLTDSELHLDGNDSAIYDLVLRGSSSLSGDVGSNGGIRIRGDSGGGHADLTVSAPVISRGALVMETQNSTYSVSLDATGSSFRNEGEMQVLQGNNGTRTVLGDFTNAGTVDLQYNTAFRSGAVQNEGQWTIQSGVKMSPNDTVTFIHQAGNLNILGEFEHSGGTDQLLGGTITGVPHFLSSNLEFGPSFTTAFDGLVGGTSSLTGAPASGQKLTLRGDSSGSNSTLSLAESVDNQGTFEMTTANSGYTTTLDTGAFTFTNSGDFLTTQGNNGTRNINGSFHNTGNLDIGYLTNFNTGPVVNSGNLTVQDGIEMKVNTGTLFEMDGGTMNVIGSFLHSSGTDRLLGGTVDGLPIFRDNTLEFGSGFTTNDAVQIQGASTLASDSPSSANLMLIGASGGGNASLSLSAPATIAGNLEMTTTNAAYLVTLNAEAGNDLTITGNLTTTAGNNGTRVLNGGFDNQGSIDIAYDATLNIGPFTNQGSLTVQAGKEFTVSSGVDFHQASGSLNVDGTFLQTSGNAQFSGGAINGIPRLRGCATDFMPSFTSAGVIQLEGVGSFNGEIMAGQTLRLMGISGGGNHITTVSNGLTNNGALELTTTNAAYSTTLNVSGGALINNGSLDALVGNNGSRLVQAELDNRGTFDAFRSTTLGLAGHNHVNSGEVTNHDGTLTVVGDSFTNQADGRISGVGEIDFNQTTSTPQNDGVWAPGLSAGKMRVDGNWAQGAGGTLEIELGGYLQDTEYDHLEIDDTATLDGEVLIHTINGFKPKFGDLFTVLSAGSINGTFSAVTVQGDLPLGYGIEMVYTATSAIAQVVQVINGIGPDATTLRISDPVPGIAGQNNTFQVDGATGYGPVILVWGTAAGSTAIPGCSSTSFGIQSAQIGGQVNASSTGTALFNVNVPSSASGLPVLYQALDTTRCLVSDVKAFTFQ